MSTVKGIEKDDILEFRIDDMSTDGSGIGHISLGQADGRGFALFVKDAAPGDFVRAKVIRLKKSYGYARLLEVLEPSPDRTEPLCPAARQCGGCQFQHLSYRAQLDFKKNMVENLLARIGGFEGIKIPPVIGMEDPWHYRNKAQYPVGRDKNGRTVIGFYAGRTHSIIDLDKYEGAEGCAIQDADSVTIAAICRQWMESFRVPAYDEKSGKGLIRHILTRKAFSTGQIMVCLIINGQSLPHARDLTQALAAVPGMTSICVSPNKRRDNVILGERAKTIWGSDTITDYIGDIGYRISPLSFYQVNPVQTKVLYETALSFADPKEGDTVWDLYCGIGTISLFLAQKAGRVYGVEIVPQAVEDARKNAQLNGIENAVFFTGKAEEVVPREAKKRPDIIVVDPPRKGCDRSLLDFIIKTGPDRLVYVSCGPATLARDLKILAEGGYELKKIQCVDMFPQGCHVECVVLMSKANTSEALKGVKTSGLWN